MLARRRGFALLIVLIAAAALFAMAMHAALGARSATIEARMLLERGTTLRQARSAASLVVSALGSTPERYEKLGGGGKSSSSGPSDAPPDDDDDEPEMELPQIIKDLVGDLLKPVEEGLQEQNNSAEGSGLAGRVRRNRITAPAKLTVFPSTPIIVPARAGAPAMRVNVADAFSQVNINMASRDELIRFFVASGIDTRLAADLSAQIIDWRDEDSSPLPGGAEQSDYLVRNIACRNGPFVSTDELLYLPAMTRDVFARIRADLTAWGDGRVHVASASRAVLLALPGMDEEIVSAIMQARAEGPITQPMLERLLPIRAREAQSRLRVDPNAAVRVRVEPVDRPGPSFEGIAVLDESGAIDVLTMQPIELPEPAASIARAAP